MKMEDKSDRSGKSIKGLDSKYLNTPSNESAGEQVILATASYDHDIKLWEASTGQCLRSLQHVDSQVNAMDITPDRRHLAAAGHQHIRMYDLQSTNVNHQIPYGDGKNVNVTAIGFQEDGKWMFTGGEDGKAKIWDLKAPNLKVSRIFEVNAPVNCVCLHPNQAELFVGDQNGVIHIWDIKTEHNEQLIPEPDKSIQSIAIDPAGMYMAAVNNKGKAYVWKLSGGSNGTPIVLTPTRSIQAHSKAALKVYFSPDSKLMVTTSADQTAKVWKTSDFSLLTELKAFDQRWVWDAAFSADSQFVLTGSSDSIARLWSIETGEVKIGYIGHRRAISALAFRDKTL